MTSLMQSASASTPTSSPKNADWTKAAAALAATRSFLESLNATHAIHPPKQVEVKEKEGVFATEVIPSGTRYGPFLGKWTLEPLNEAFAWQVILASSGIQGFLDATEYPTWIKYIRCISNEEKISESSLDGHKSNVRHVLINGQIYYETIGDIEMGMELLLGSKEPICLDQGINTSQVNKKEVVFKGSKEESSSRGSEEEGDDDNDNEVKCIKCEKIFLDIFNLDKHMVGAHSYKPEQHQCEHCSQSFAWRPNLLRHKMVHGEFRRFPCENCDKVFTDPSNLQRHIRANHVGARSHACPECGKTFATSSGLKQHTHIHSSVKPFRCEVCFKSYTQFSNLCRHKRMHANCRMQIKCHKCGQAFSTVTSLSKHRRFCDSTPTSPFVTMHQGSGQDPSKPLSSALQELSPPKQQVHNFATSSQNFNLNVETSKCPMQSESTSSLLQSPQLGMISPFAHLFQQEIPNSPLTTNEVVYPSPITAMASATGQLNLFQPPNPFFLPSMLQNIASQHFMANQGQWNPQIRACKNVTFGRNPNASSKSPNLNLERSLLEKDASNNPQTISSHKRENSCDEDENISAKLLKKKKIMSKDQRDGDTAIIKEELESKDFVDFNENISTDNEVSNKSKKPENPLDLSVYKGEEEDLIKTKSNNKDKKLIQDRKLIYYDETLSRKGNLKIAQGQVDKKEQKKSGTHYDMRDKSADHINHEIVQNESSERFWSLKKGTNFVLCDENVLNSDLQTDLFQEKCKNKGSSEKGNSIQSSPERNTFPLYSHSFHPLLEVMYRIHQHQRPIFPQSSRTSPLNPLIGGTLRSLLPSMLTKTAATGVTISEQEILSNRYPVTSPFSALAVRAAGTVQDDNSLLSKNQTSPLSKDRYSCKFCGKVFPRSANLTRHLRTHTGEQPYKCKYCERSFSISSNLQRHVRNIHNKEKPFKCPLCDRSFGQQTNLDRHIKKHETCSDPNSIIDSPEGRRSPDEDSYFDEIRSFMGKVGVSSSVFSPEEIASDEQEIDVEDDEISVEHD